MTFKSLLGMAKKRYGVGAIRAAAIIKVISGAIAKRAMNEGPVLIPGFGTFYKSETIARNIRNPATGKIMRLPKSYRLAFRASKFRKGFS